MIRRQKHGSSQPSLKGTGRAFALSALALAASSMLSGQAFADTETSGYVCTGATPDCIVCTGTISTINCGTLDSRQDACESMGYGRGQRLEADVYNGAFEWCPGMNPSAPPSPPGCVSSNKKLDVMFFADNTGSMGPYLDSVKARATSILSQMTGGDSRFNGVDIQFAVTNYLHDTVELSDPDYTGYCLPPSTFSCCGTVDRPTPPRCHPGGFNTSFGPYNVLQGFTNSTSTTQNGINSWFASQGGDLPEGQFEAMTQLVSSGWRSDAGHVVVWLGDAYSHTETKSQAEAAAALQSINAYVIALNANTTNGANSINYNGQATAIAGSTGGVHDIGGLSDAQLATLIVNQVAEGLEDTCSPPPPVGSCASFPSTYSTQPANSAANGCTAGTYTDTPDSGTHFRWTCGSATCLAEIAAPPPPPPGWEDRGCGGSIVASFACGMEEDDRTCNANQRLLVREMTNCTTPWVGRTYYQTQCQDDATCTTPPPPTGTCGSFPSTYSSQPANASNGCTAGTYADTTDDASYFRWTCGATACQAAVAASPPPSSCTWTQNPGSGCSFQRPDLQADTDCASFSGFLGAGSDCSMAGSGTTCTHGLWAGDGAPYGTCGPGPQMTTHTFTCSGSCSPPPPPTNGCVMTSGTTSGGQTMAQVVQDAASAGGFSTGDLTNGYVILDAAGGAPVRVCHDNNSIAAYYTPYGYEVLHAGSFASSCNVGACTTPPPPPSPTACRFDNGGHWLGSDECTAVCSVSVEAALVRSAAGVTSLYTFSSGPTNAEPTSNHPGCGATCSSRPIRQSSQAYVDSLADCGSPPPPPAGCTTYVHETGPVCADVPGGPYEGQVPECVMAEDPTVTAECSFQDIATTGNQTGTAMPEGFRCATRKRNPVGYDAGHIFRADCGSSPPSGTCASFPDTYYSQPASAGNGCTAGTYADATDTSSQFVWNCGTVACYASKASLPATVACPDIWAYNTNYRNTARYTPSNTDMSVYNQYSLTQEAGNIWQLWVDTSQGRNFNAAQQSNTTRRLAARFSSSGTPSFTYNTPLYDATFSLPATDTLRVDTVTFPNADMVCYDLPHGRCGTSAGQTFNSIPTANLCSQGYPTAVVPNGTTYNWSCIGIGSGAGGGSTALCSATRDVTGSTCLPISEYCLQGVTTTAAEGCSQSGCSNVLYRVSPVADLSRIMYFQSSGGSVCSSCGATPISARGPTELYQLATCTPPPQCTN
jgi:hypothetical protein